MLLLAPALRERTVTERLDTYGKRQRLLREDEEITQAELADRVNSILARKKGNGPSTVTQSYITMS